MVVCVSEKQLDCKYEQKQTSKHCLTLMRWFQARYYLEQYFQEIHFSSSPQLQFETDELKLIQRSFKIKCHQNSWLLINNDKKTKKGRHKVLIVQDGLQ